MKAIITLEDEVNATVTGLSKADINELWNKYAVFAKNYFHRPKYKMGVWDGKIKFFTKNGKTYVRLLPEIVPILKEKGYGIKLNDKRLNYEITIPYVDKNYLKENYGFNIELAEHQVRCINSLTSNNNGIILAGTGAGKTLMTAVLCDLYEKHMGFRSIVIVPRGDLITQTKDELLEHGVDCGEYGGSTKDTDHQHIVSTWQSLQNNKQFVSQFPVVIVDECHGVSGQVLKDILNGPAAKALVKIGLTGTLPEEDIDLMSIRVTLGHVVESVKGHELVKSGWLAMPNIHMVNLKENLREEYHDFCQRFPEDCSNLKYSQFKRDFFPDFQSEKAHLQRREERIKFIAEMIETASKRKKGNTLVLVPNIQFGQKIAREIPDAIFFHGKDSKKIRKQIYETFDEESNFVAITTYSLASTGLNIKRIFNFFMVDAGKSYIQIIQSIGRGLRKSHDKDTVNIFDIHSDLKFSKKHATIREKHYKKEQYPYKKRTVEYLDLNRTLSEE